MFYKNTNIASKNQDTLAGFEAVRVLWLSNSKDAEQVSYVDNLHPQTAWPDVQAPRWRWVCVHVGL
jgi:hypothetical protein